MSLRMTPFYSTIKRIRGWLQDTFLWAASLLIRYIDYINGLIIYKIFAFLRKSFVRSDQRFLEFRFYPVKPKKRIMTDICPEKQIGVVIQGPADAPVFVYNTAIWYLELGAKVVVISTTTQLRKIPKKLRRNELIHWHHCSEPANCGLWNTNRQIKSSYEGISFLAELGIDYTIKTRTDQRCYSEFFLVFLSRLVETFPAKSGAERIVAVTNNTLLGKVNNVSDHFYFGRTTTLLRAFANAERSLSLAEAMEIAGAADEKEFQVYRMSHRSSDFPRIEAEQYLFSRITSTFIDYVDNRVELKDYIDAVSDYWILVDPEDLDMFWRKTSIEDNCSWDNGHPFRWHRYSGYRATHEIWRIMAESIDFRQELLNDCIRAKELSCDFFTSLHNRT